MGLRNKLKMASAAVLRYLKR